MKTETWYVLEESESYFLVISFDLNFTNLFSLPLKLLYKAPPPPQVLILILCSFPLWHWSHFMFTVGLTKRSTHCLFAVCLPSSQIHRQRYEVNFVFQSIWQDRCSECFELMNISINGVYLSDFKQFIILFMWCWFHFLQISGHAAVLL